MSIKLMSHGIPLRVAGALTGDVYVASLDSPVSELRLEVARLLGVQNSTHVKILAGGRNLQDDAKSLRDYNVVATSRLLVMRGAVAGQQLGAEAERAHRLETLRRAADKLASRDGRGLSEHRELSLENQDVSNDAAQDGIMLKLKPGDQKAMVMGMVMYDKGRAAMRLAAQQHTSSSLSIALPAPVKQADGASTSGTTTSMTGSNADSKGSWASALDVLLIAEEAFSLADDTLLSCVDNFAMLLIDIVWCCYQLGDIRRLAVSRDRLQRARSALERAHGPNLRRLRTLSGNFQPELAMYIRLEVLEGVVAYHLREAAAASAALHSARDKWRRLQVGDAPLAMLHEMGYGTQESTRALRFTGGDLEAAVTFISDQRNRKQDRSEKRKRLSAWNTERKKYGKTSSGQYVDVEACDALVAMGYDRAVAAEALRQHDNQGGLALESLLDDLRRNAIMLALVARNIQEVRPELQPAKPAMAAANCEGAQATSAGTADEAATNRQAGGSGSGGSAAQKHLDSESQAVEEDLLKDVETDPMAAYDIDVTQEGDILCGTGGP